MLPRKRWTRQVEVNAHPNQCAASFNELLHALIRRAHIVPLYEDFIGTGDRCNGRLYKKDGLHPNKMGQQLLATLIKMEIYSDITPPPITQSKPEEPEDEFKDARAFNPLVGESGLALRYGRVNVMTYNHSAELSGESAPCISDLGAFPPLSDGTAQPGSISTDYVDALLKPVAVKVSSPPPKPADLSLIHI